jgi:hypothetical protein
LTFAGKAVDFLVEVVGLEPAELGPGYTGTPLQFSQIDPLQGEITSLLGLHLFYGL